MLYISHRVNQTAKLADLPREYGVELDLRDYGSRLVLQHDPYINDDAEDFEDYLQEYRHGLMIVNVKSERIEFKAAELLAKYGITNYFFLDSSFPMLRQLVARGERRAAIRFSEFEPIEYALAMAGQIDWVWVDCFTKLPLTPASHAALKKHFKLCLVSPELQGRSADTISSFAAEAAPYAIDAVCTKYPERWRAALGNAGAKAA